MPLAVSAGLGFGLVLGAAAVTLSPAIGAVVATITTCSSTSACIGGTNSGSGPGVSGTSQSGNGVTASSTSSNAILATNNTANHATILAQQSGAGTAIFGAANKGSGVSGTATTGTGVSGTSTSGTGVSGSAMNGTGVYGASKSGSGVTATSTSSYAILASNNTATQATILATQQGSGTAIIGSANKGLGVFGSATSGAGVGGTATSGTGVIGTSSSGIGVIASSTTSTAISGSNTSTNKPTILAQQLGSGTAIAGSANKGSGVTGTATSGTGVSGTSSSGIGMNGTSSSGIGINGTSSSGAGISGSSSTSVGLTGNSLSSVGVSGSGVTGGQFTGSQEDGIDGITDSTFQTGDPQPDGVAGFDFSAAPATGSPCSIFPGPGCSSGVYGYSTNSQAAYFTVAAADIVPTVTIQSGSPANTGRIPLLVTTSDYKAYQTFNDEGDLFLSGELYTDGSCNNGCIKKSVRSYTARESEPTIEDVGRSQLVAGSAYVALDSAFANVVDSRSDYAVLITPEGDSNGVFVAARSPRGFLVRENRGGRSSLVFSYRIVAKPLGKSEPRLPFINRRDVNPAAAAAAAAELRARMARIGRHRAALR